MSDSTELPVGTLEGILSAPDSKEDYVNIPEWGVRVKVKGLTKKEQILARKKSTSKGILDESKLEGLIFVAGMVEPRITPDKVDQLFEKSSGAVDRIFRLSGMDGAVDSEAESDFRD
jgi:hypothetical protein